MLTLHRLRTEYAATPLGLGETAPRLSWELSEGTQFAYRLQADNGWDTGRIESNQSVAVPYDGPELKSRQRVAWTVTVWTEAGEATASSGFEMGLLHPEDWTARWIEGPLAGGPRSTVPATTFQGTVVVKEAVRSARLYVAALGIVDFRINTKRTTDSELLPGWTDYTKRVRYSVHDVKELLEVGCANVLEGTLGSGWYCGKIGWRERGFYGERPRLIAQLEIVTESGERIVVGTDSTWVPYVEGTLDDDLLDGESIDARRDGPYAIGKAILAPPYAGKLDAWNSPPIRPVRVLKPVSRERNLFDFGQNLVGRIRLQANGKGGETVVARYAERLDGGKLYTANYRAARSTDHLTLSQGLNDLTTSFTFHGFQYAELAGLPEEAEVEAVVLSSDLEPTGTFVCSEPLLNQLWSNIEWGWRGNSLDVPTDCPQRDERLGWTGDAQVFVRTSMFLSDAGTFWEKYSQDLADSQKPDGRIPPVAPDPDMGMEGGPAWSDAVVICPWTVYRCTGDPRILERNADPMRRWVDWLATSAKDGIRCYEGYEGWRGFGDWLNTQAETPHEIIGTAFYAHVARLMAKVERVLGRDGAAYDELADTVRAAFVREFAGRLDTQTANVLALHFDILPETQRLDALRRLVEDIEARGDHLSTGFVGTPYLPHVLTAGGRLDVAYRLLLQRSWPSYLYPVTQGATTIWERWDGWTEDKGFQDVGMNSFNHYAYGAIGDWMASTVAGIDLDPEIPGYKRSRLAPRPGGGLTHAEASLKTAYGRLASAWRTEAGRFAWTVEVPPNTTARAVLPPEAGGRTIELAPGRHAFEEPWTA